MSYKSNRRYRPRSFSDYAAPLFVAAFVTSIAGAWIALLLTVPAI